VRFTPEQDRALSAVIYWFKHETHRKQVFRLFGYAGTGKTTLAKYIAEHIDNRVIFAAFTGKAAHVMRSKGCTDARTLHSLIYKCYQTEDGPQFRLDKESPFAGAKLLIIDECSMVDAQLGCDVLSFGVPVLVLGDPAQLPPIYGNGFFTNAPPDAMLTDVQRQALDSPLIRMATTVRQGGRLELGSYGSSRVIPCDAITYAEGTTADQILVGRNKTRRLLNDRLRNHLKLFGAIPQPSDRLICLRNNHSLGLLNGSMWVTRAAIAGAEDSILLTIAADDAPSSIIHTTSHLSFFRGTTNEMSYLEQLEFNPFDFAYAITVHKAQGSQWDNVVLFDESSYFKPDQHRWLYTGITRAAEKLTVVLL
jgi:exodeoxyribonuclease-5